MPIYTRYKIEVETTVKVTTDDGATVGLFAVNNEATADSDKCPIDKAIMAAVDEMERPVSKHAVVVSENEHDRLRR